LRVKNEKSRQRTKTDLIIEVWEQLDCASVGAAELEKIQNAVKDTLGAGAVDSPAAIARVLADEGAVLRHPEVLDLDSAWRRRGIPGFADVNFSSLSEALLAMAELDRWRREFEPAKGNQELRRLREFVSDVRDDLRLRVISEAVPERDRAEAREIAEWLLIWQATPDLFADWLDLRLASAEFLTLFPEIRGRRSE
jgi:hypothetical protein